ncbi:unnamed protein product [Prunus armeniaca]|uniref:Uncharacterized protein n=1 Tax=Prunus armeniaca TaxID=36596 RepID=A0A6J5Y673_PRUAR|nr:unnamed protein product [Prunus armeniaca]
MLVETGLSGGLAYTNNLLPAAPIGLLGLLLLFQTTRVRFVFDDEALFVHLTLLRSVVFLEVKVGEQLQNSVKMSSWVEKSLEILNVCELGALVAKFPYSGVF